MAGDRGRRISRERFAKLREGAMMSLRDLAEEAGVAFTTVQAIESGETTSPHFGTIRKLAAALKVDARDLLEREYAPKARSPRVAGGETQVEILQHALARYQEREERNPERWSNLYGMALLMLERTQHPDLREEYEEVYRRGYDGWLSAKGISRDDPDAAQAIEEMLRELREPVEA
ncbi:MAG: helix-turn-helix transcriptional regulator [Rubrobacteraceae bacterium]